MKRTHLYADRTGLRSKPILTTCGRKVRSAHVAYLANRDRVTCPACLEKTRPVLRDATGKDISWMRGGD